jgi:hypothetical protein
MQVENARFLRLVQSSLVSSYAVHALGFFARHLCSMHSYSSCQQMKPFRKGLNRYSWSIMNRVRKTWPAWAGSLFAGMKIVQACKLLLERAFSGLKIIYQASLNRDPGSLPVVAVNHPRQCGTGRALRMGSVLLVSDE